MMAVLLDSGFLLASLNSSEAEHQATIEVLESIHEPIVLPVPAITEVAYLLARDIGNDVITGPRISLASGREKSVKSSVANSRAW